ncbi:MAG: SAM-dependent methyltransferase, partial [Pseudomonadota bacterium]
MAATSAEFWDRVADRYSKRAIADPETHERKLHSTQALMRLEMKILEFGCGTGSTALLHAPH